MSKQSTSSSIVASKPSKCGKDAKARTKRAPRRDPRPWRIGGWILTNDQLIQLVRTIHPEIPEDSKHYVSAWLNVLDFVTPLCLRAIFSNPSERLGEGDFIIVSRIADFKEGYEGMTDFPLFIPNKRDERARLWLESRGQYFFLRGSGSGSGVGVEPGVCSRCELLRRTAGAFLASPVVSTTGLVRRPAVVTGVCSLDTSASRFIMSANNALPFFFADLLPPRPRLPVAYFETTFRKSRCFFL